MPKGGQGGKKSARSPSQAQSGREYAAQQRKASGAAAHDSGSARLQALAKLLSRKEKLAPNAEDTMRCRVQLAEGYLAERMWERALPLLSKSLELHPDDPLLPAQMR